MVLKELFKKNLKNKLYGSFLSMGFNRLKAIKPLRGGSLLFTNQDNTFF